MITLKTKFALGAAGGRARSVIDGHGGARAGEKQQSTPDVFPEGALAPDNLHKPRPKPPFNLTGTWMVDLSSGFSSFMFGPNYPKFKPAAQAIFDEGKKVQRGRPRVPRRHRPMLSRGHAHDHDARLADRDDSDSDGDLHGQWFENALRMIYIDGRKHTRPRRGRPHLQRRFGGTLGGRYARGGYHQHDSRASLD